MGGGPGDSFMGVEEWRPAGDDRRVRADVGSSRGWPRRRMTDPLSGPSSGARHEDSHPARDDGPHRLRVGFDRDRSIHDGRELDTGGPEGPGHILSIDRALSIADEIEPVAEEVEPGSCRLRPRFRASPSDPRVERRLVPGLTPGPASGSIMRGGSTSRAGRSRSIPPRARSMRPGRRHPPMWSKVRHRRKTRPRLFTSGPAPDNQPASHLLSPTCLRTRNPRRQDRVRAGGFSFATSPGRSINPSDRRRPGYRRSHG